MIWGYRHFRKPQFQNIPMLHGGPRSPSHSSQSFRDIICSERAWAATSASRFPTSGRPTSVTQMTQGSKTTTLDPKTAKKKKSNACSSTSLISYPNWTWSCKFCFRYFCVWMCLAYPQSSTSQASESSEHSVLFQIDPNCSCQWFILSQFHNQFHSHSSRILNSRSSCKW